MKSNEPSQTLTRVELERLYVEMEGKLFNIIYRYVWNENDAQELVQEAFVKLWQRRQEIASMTASSYLYKSAVNLALNHKRKRKLWRLVGLGALERALSSDPSPDDVIETTQEMARLQRAMDGLSEKLRRTLTLCEYSDLSYREIGELLNIPPGTVASRRAAAVEALKNALEVEAS